MSSTASVPVSCRDALPVARRALDRAPAWVQTPAISSGGGIAVIRAVTLWAVSLALVASIALGPTPALAQRGAGMARGGGGFIAAQTARGGTSVVGGGTRGGTFVAGRGPGGAAFIAGQTGARGFVHQRDGFHRHPVHRGFNSFGTVVIYGAPYAYWPYYDMSLYSQPLAYAPSPTHVASYTPPVNNTLSLSPPSPRRPAWWSFRPDATSCAATASRSRTAGCGSRSLPRLPPWSCPRPRRRPRSSRDQRITPRYTAGPTSREPCTTRTA